MSRPGRQPTQEFLNVSHPTSQSAFRQIQPSWPVIATLLFTLTLGYPQAPDQRGFRGVQELESFLDGILAAQRESLNIAGAVVVVVANGEIYFSKGYGYADLAAQRPVDPQTTLFRIGSVSKPFVATAVMQLWEQKQMNLDTDVNLYLRALKVPPTFPRPITLGHLLAHTAGFEDRDLGRFSYHPAAVRPLGTLLTEQLPERVRPPGNLSVYSNHGYALAAFAVQETARLSWDDYLDEQILEPLGMTHTTGRQPVPPDLTRSLAIGYQSTQGRLEPTGFEHVPIGPAAAMSASGHDMARFMIAHLRLGRYDDAQLLSEETARLMHSPLFSGARGINRMLHGFYEMDQNGERIFGHAGRMISFHSHLALLPERDIGVFVSYNSDTGARAVQDFWQAFLNHYFPAPPAPKPARPSSASLERMEKFAGEYSALRRSQSTLTKLSSLLWTVQVDFDPAGYLLTRGLGNTPRRWTEIEPMLFREVDGTQRIAFRTEDAGHVIRLLPDFPALAFERNHWHQTRTFHLATAGLSLLLLGSALIFWPVAAWCTTYRHESERPPWTPRIWAWLMSLLFVGFFGVVGAVAQNPMQFWFGVPDLLRYALWLPIAAGLFIPLTLLFMLRAWVNGYWGFAGRLHYTLVAFASATLLAWLWHWNLIGFRF
jgi:CubicO group peptidase (beta-lactamase class C family)